MATARLSLLTDQKLSTVSTVYRELVTDAPMEVQDAGLRWYLNAHTECLHMSAETGYSVEQCAGIVAALSPRTPWDVNLAAAWDVARRGRAACRITGKAWNTGDNLGKAWAIQAGLSPENAFAPDTKTWAFWHNLSYPQHSTRVTLDAWALRVVGLPEQAKGPGYRLISAAVSDAADQLSLLPHQVQAVVWLVAREILHLRPGEYCDIGPDGLEVISEG